jgi:hypothetical protein
MKRRSMTLAFLLAAALAACQGTSTYAPQAGPMSVSPAVQLARASVPAPYDAVFSGIPDASQLCNAPDVKIPGSYLEMLTSGGVKGSTYTSAGALNIWFLVKYTKGTKPTPTPKPVDVYYYTGTYTTHKSKETGCAVLIVTKSGKPLSKGAGNGLGINTVQYADKYVNTALSLSGVLSETVSSLSASGGHGSATLKTTKNKQYDTLTITLTKRIEVKY